MSGLIFSIVVSIGLPLAFLVYACFRKNFAAYLLGILAFVGSQMLLRIPLLEYLGKNSTEFIMFSKTQPVIFAIIIGLSAGIFEEVARFIFMRFLMSKRDWYSGFLFGAGHGGIEAVLIVGAPAIALLFTQTMIFQSEMLFVGGIERLFAMILHIGLSIIVLQGVVQKNFMYVLLAIVIHGLVDASVGILPLYISSDKLLFVQEVMVAIIALAVFIYSIRIKRKEDLQ
ncbi:YhfC family glutamic-type intramembrane protease [Pseudogracilibacillus sp. SO30301A]|uniref:YhfC family glutamic-type intramembrane protease n=1 Tax=Pseudogracilibacillus sp. SO30301A TaxID=3098291 RepID=UPI00300DDA43